MPDAAAILLRSAQQLGIYTAKDTAQLDFMVIGGVSFFGISL